jgi:hypothetical protein
VPDRHHPADPTGARSPGGQLVAGQHPAPGPLDAAPDAAPDARPWGPLRSTLARTCIDQAAGGLHAGAPEPQRAAVHRGGGSSAGRDDTALGLPDRRGPCASAQRRVAREELSAGA